MTEELNILGKTLKISSSGGGVSEDLSGALIELSATVTAGKKLLAQSLQNKGVENISHTDNLSRMAQAVDALDGAGNGLDPKIPLLILPKSINNAIGIDDTQLTSTSRQWRKLPGKPNIIWRNYNAGIRLADTLGKTFDGTEPVDLDIPLSAVRTALGLAASELTFSSYPKFFYDAATTSFILISNDLKAVKIAITFNDVLAQSTWSAQILQDSLTSADGNTMSGGLSLIAYNSQKNKAIVNTASNFFIVDLALGTYKKFVWPKTLDTYSTPPIFYGYEYNGISAFAFKQSDTYNDTTLTVFFIDWDAPEESGYIDAPEAFNPQTGFVFDYESGKILLSNFGEFDLSQRKYTPGIALNRNMCGDGDSGSGSRDRTFARIIAENGDILQLDSWCAFSVFSPEKEQRLLPGEKSGQVAGYNSSYGMGTPCGRFSYMTLGHLIEINNKLCFCDDEKIYEPIIDYTRFICWPLTRNGKTVYLKPSEKFTFDEFMAEDSPFLRESVILPVDISEDNASDLSAEGGGE